HHFSVRLEERYYNTSSANPRKRSIIFQWFPALPPSPVQPLRCHPRACPEGPLCRGTGLFRRGWVSPRAWIAGTNPAMTALKGGCPFPSPRRDRVGGRRVRHGAGDALGVDRDVAYGEALAQL